MDYNDYYDFLMDTNDEFQINTQARLVTSTVKRETPGGNPSLLVRWACHTSVVKVHTGRSHRRTQ